MKKQERVLQINNLLIFHFEDKPKITLQIQFDLMIKKKNPKLKTEIYTEIGNYIKKNILDLDSENTCAFKEKSFDKLDFEKITFRNQTKRKFSIQRRMINNRKGFREAGSNI
jgi:hypothetical protein